MPRLPPLESDNIPKELIPKGFSLAYVTTQKRLYIRKDKKFVGYGFIVRFFQPNTGERTEIILRDDQLIDYF